MSELLCGTVASLGRGLDLAHAQQVCRELTDRVTEAMPEWFPWWQDPHYE